MASDQQSDLHWLRLAVELSHHCPKTDKSFAVGAVILDRLGQLVSSGYSLELGPGWHAEEVALHKASEAGADLSGGTIYSSLEPCSVRLSGKRSCAERIVESGFSRAVFALKEPPVFVAGAGGAVMLEHGIEVIQITELSGEVEEINRHIVPRVD